MLRTISVLLTLLSCIFILDIAVSKDPVMHKVESVSKNLERYYNAAGNYHYSYAITAGETTINASQEFSDNIDKGDTLSVRKSLFFNEINSIIHVRSGSSETYSLRYFTGFVIPLFILCVVLINLKSGKYIVLLGVSTILAIANLIFLIL